MIKKGIIVEKCVLFLFWFFFFLSCMGGIENNRYLWHCYQLLDLLIDGLFWKNSIGKGGKKEIWELQIHEGL